MAELIVKNSLNSQVAVHITVTLHESAIKGDIDEADTKWLLMVGTTHLDLNDATIPPVVVHNLSEASIDFEIENAVEIICAQIDWGDLRDDKESPLIISYGPTGDDVSIHSKINIRVKDELPSSGLDFTDLSVMFNNGVLDFDITNDVYISGGPFEYTLSWQPDTIITDTYH